jgi:hypothetical protein
MAMPNSKNSDRPKIEESIAKLREIQIGFEQKICSLHQKIVMLYSTPELQNIFKNLKKEAENRAINVEAEVKRLREELKYAQALLGLELENSNSGNS